MHAKTLCGAFLAAGSTVGLVSGQEKTSSAPPPPTTQNDSIQQQIEKVRSELEARMSAMQERYEARIRGLEERLDGKQQAEEPGAEFGDALADLEQALREAPPDQVHGMGQTTRFDPAFNPAIGLVLDFSGSAANLDDGYADFNKMRLRVAELGVSARIDPYTWAYGVLEFSEEGEARVAELAAMLNLDRIFPESEFRLKAGRFLSDLDPLNPVHEHDYPFVHQPAVKAEFFGGNLGGSGVELHHWFPLGEVPVRWSVGMLTDAGGDTETEGVAHQHHSGAEPFGRRDFRNFQYTARLVAAIPVGEEDTLSLGGSLLWAPQVRLFEENAAPPPAVLRHDTRQFVSSLDISYKYMLPSGNGFTLAAAIFRNLGLFFDEATSSRFREGAYGSYSYLDVRLNKEWSVGVAFDWTQQAEDHSQDFTQYSTFVTWRLSPLNRLRLQVQYTDVDPSPISRFSEDFSAVFLQWTLVLGSHAHGVDW